MEDFGLDLDHQAQDFVHNTIYGERTQQDSYSSHNNRQPERVNIPDDEEEFSSSRSAAELSPVSTLSGNKRSSPDYGHLPENRKKRYKAAQINYEFQNQQSTTPQSRRLPLQNQYPGDVSANQQQERVAETASSQHQQQVVVHESAVSQHQQQVVAPISSLSTMMPTSHIPEYDNMVRYADHLKYHMSEDEKKNHLERIEFIARRLKAVNQILVDESHYINSNEHRNLIPNSSFMNDSAVATVPPYQERNFLVGTVEHFHEHRIYSDRTYTDGNAVFQEISSSNFELIYEHCSPDLAPYYIKSCDNPKNFLWNIYNLFKQIVLWANEALDNHIYTPEDLLFYSEMLDTTDQAAVDNRKGSQIQGAKHSLYVDVPIDYHKIIRKENSFCRNMYLLFYHTLHSYAFYVIEDGKEEIFSEGGKFDIDEDYSEFEEVNDTVKQQRRKKNKAITNHFKNRGNIIKLPGTFTKANEGLGDIDPEKFSVDYVKEHFEKEGRHFNEENVIHYLKANNYKLDYRLEVLNKKCLSSNLTSALSKFALEMTCYREGVYKGNLHNKNKITPGDLNNRYFSDDVTEYEYVQSGSSDEKFKKDTRKNRIRSMSEILKLLNFRKLLLFNYHTSKELSNLGMSSVINLLGLKKRDKKQKKDATNEDE